ncbi:sugar phosphate isomerase/epimerase [Prochlorococcus sp. AH-716-K03]|nr:sugar phosphate isomerase/epimerase [Prochlorococcus sp. AH-716-K03]
MEKNYLNFGIMQGRLSQKENLPLQSFPYEWEEEFSRAKELGFSKIEWLIDKEISYSNPLFSAEGRKKILEIKKNKEININTLCAHFLINGKILKNNQESDNIRSFFIETLKLAPLIGVKYLSIPLIEEMSLNKKDICLEIKYFLKEIIKEIKVEILIEADLKNFEIIDFIESIGSTKIGILYDTGNATKNNFIFSQEFPSISKMVKEIHIKDFDIKSKKSVRLGNGDTDFRDIFKTITKHQWEGPIILETPIFYDWYKEAYLNLNYIRKFLQT